MDIRELRMWAEFLPREDQAERRDALLAGLFLCLHNFLVGRRGPRRTWKQIWPDPWRKKSAPPSWDMLVRQFQSRPVARSRGDE